MRWSSRPRAAVAEKERIEIEYWRDSPTEAPGVDSLDNLINKLGEARIFLAYLRKLEHLLARRGTVLELGAGQGWSSCIYKRMFPDACVVATDISAYALASVDYWQRIFAVQIDRRYACRSYATGERDASVDLVYCFAAAHHFVEHGKTLAEVQRILKPGGRAVYLHEPVCSRWLYPLAYRRVNAVRPDVPEDLLVVSDMRRLAREAGLDMQVLRNHALLEPWAFPTLNYRLQRLVPPLASLLPSSATFVFSKPHAGDGAAG
ncbi:MAG TPA: class I SAM-dependent methyltransferase [Gammaproteobacteria bacterium]